MESSIADELVGIDLGDKRLNKRSVKVLEGLHADTQSSVNGAFDNWADTLGAYRLFDNPAVTPEKIFEPHYQATRQRMQEYPVVLVVQDTTDLNYTPHPPQDARCLNKADQLGFYDHTLLATTPDGVPVGLLDTQWFDRAAESLGKRHERVTLPLEEKESFRWLQGFRRASQVAEQCPQTQVVCVADREADMYDMYLEAQQAGTADYVIRSKEENRCTTTRVPPAEHDSRCAVYRKIRDEVRGSPLKARRTVALPQTPQRESRVAELEIRALSVTMKPPKNRTGLAPADCNVVHVQEVGYGGEDAVQWWLITSLPIDTLEEVERIIDYYRARWTIEVYFRTLKTGCRVEKLQLETVARLQNCLAFYKIIAWRVLMLTHLNRHDPTLSCDTVFTDCEWQAVWQVTTKQPVPKKPPSLGEFMRLLASLGGYNNRPNEPPPGPQPIWIGIRRMHDFALAWLCFQQSLKTCV